MNILMINKFYFERGGAERYVFELTKLLEEKGHRVIPLAMKHGENLATKYEKYFVSEIATKPSWHIWQNLRTVFRFFWSFEAQRKLKKLIKDVSRRDASTSREKIDVAHIHNIYHQISPSILPVLKKNKIPIVMTVHDYKLISPNYNLYLNGRVYNKICGRKYGRCLRDKCVNKSFVQSLICFLEMWWHHKILKVYEKSVDVFIAPSKFVKEKLVAGGYDKNKVKVVPHFVEASEHQNLRMSEEEEKYILYFGRLSEEKGIDVLIKAMQQLPNVKLKIVGEGPSEIKLKTQLTKLKVKNVELLGYKNKDELREIIAGAELVVMPSLAPESFGLSALEAMALGKVVVASKIGTLPELVDKEFLVKSGQVKELIDKISDLTKQPDYVKMKGYQNRERVEQMYGPKQHYQQIMAVYQELATRR